MQTFKNFCAAPFEAVERGYLPSYLDVVSAHAVAIPTILIVSFKALVKSIPDFLDLTVLEVLGLIFGLIAIPIMLITLPVWAWPASIVYKRHLVKAYHAAKKRRDAMCPSIDPRPVGDDDV